MHDFATTPRLKAAFHTHREETREHVNRLEAVFASINEPVQSSKCPAMAGIIDEANHLIDDTDDMSSQRDAALIIAAKRRNITKFPPMAVWPSLRKYWVIFQLKISWEKPWLKKKQPTPSLRK